MNPWWLLVPSAVALLALWACRRESERGDRYQAWMVEEQARADLAESRAAWLMVTHQEQKAMEYALHWLEWPPDAAQMQILASCLGPSCQAPEHKMKATLRGLLDRHRRYQEKADAAAT